MAKKHSKLKNTGVLYELLTRQVAVDIINSKPPVALNLIKRFFNKNSELAKEYSIYQSIINNRGLDATKSSVLLESIKDSYSSINTKKIQEEKYRLIEEINKSYDNNFWSARVDSYKLHASVFHLLESINGSQFSDPLKLAESKLTIMEHLMETKEKTEIDTILEDYRKYNDVQRKYIFQQMSSHVQKRLANMNTAQRNFMLDYMTFGTGVKMTAIINENIDRLKKQLLEHSYSADDPTRVKLKEVVHQLNHIKSNRANDADIIRILEHMDLVDELNNIE